MTLLDLIRVLGDEVIIDVYRNTEAEFHAMIYHGAKGTIPWRLVDYVIEKVRISDTGKLIVYLDAINFED